MHSSRLALGLVLCLVVRPLSAANAFTVLHSFDGADGDGSFATPVFDAAGNMYGTTELGGAGFGTVFKLAPDGTFSTLYAFQGGEDGTGPTGSLVVDGAGNIYGTTSGGGNLCTAINKSGCGTVYKIAPDGSETVLHAFTGGADGYAPTGGVVADGAGNLYGNTLFGGATACGEGCGTIYRIAPDGTETILHTFTGSADDGAYPLGTLLIDRKGNIYGTTSKGGSAQDYGTVFGLSKNGAEKILYVFQGGSDGEYPEAGLVRDRTGNLFGTTASGGSYQGGTAFKLAPDGTETILHSFSTLDSDMPLPGGGALVLDGHGNLFGTCVGTHSGSRGIVFELLPGGTEQVLHVFSKAKGHDPAGGLTARNGRLFGTTLQGGPSNMGVVYALHE